jgi:hypothetical protein
MRGDSDDDGGGDVAVVGKAQRQVLHAAFGGERGDRSMEAQIAAPGRIAPHFNGAVIGPRFGGLERFDCCFFRGEARGEALGGHTGRTGSTVRGFVRRKRAAHVGIPEPVECGSNFRDADDIDADVQRRPRTAMAY